MQTPLARTWIISKITVQVHLHFDFTYNLSVLVGSVFGATWEDPGLWGCFFQIRCKKSLKTRPNSPYGGETSSYSLLQQGVYYQCTSGVCNNTELQAIGGLFLARIRLNEWMLLWFFVTTYEHDSSWWLSYIITTFVLYIIEGDGGSSVMMLTYI